MNSEHTLTKDKLFWSNDSYRLNEKLCIIKSKYFYQECLNSFNCLPQTRKKRKEFVVWYGNIGCEALSSGIQIYIDIIVMLKMNRFKGNNGKT